jgi:hypothetical protein
LTTKLPVKFWNEETDTPSTPPACGLGGWTKDDKYVLLYDDYDVWQATADGSSAVCLTAGMGRKEQGRRRREDWAGDTSRPRLQLDSAAG